MRAVITLIRVFRACTGTLETRKVNDSKARSLSDVFPAKVERAYVRAPISDVKSKGLHVFALKEKLR